MGPALMDLKLVYHLVRYLKELAGAESFPPVLADRPVCTTKH